VPATRRRRPLLPPLVLLLATALVGSVLPPSAYAGPGRSKPRADLVVASVTAPARVQQGTSLPVTVAVRNAGRAAASRSTLRVSLSTDRRAGADRALAPTRAVPPLRPRRTARPVVRVTVPPATAPGAYWVVACADAGRRVRERDERNNCRVSRRPVTVFSVRTSEDLIEADVDAGRISADQGLVYRLLADFGDRRLPARYVGHGTPSGIGHGALTEVAERWSELSDTHRRLVRPFLVPAFHVGSHSSPGPLPPLVPAREESRLAFDAPWCAGDGKSLPISQDWEHLDTTRGDVRIWWLSENAGDAATAAHFADILDDRILPALEDLMGNGPAPDGNGLCDGGSTALDIALLDIPTASVYAHSTSCASATPVSMAFPRSVTTSGWKGLDPYLAHEVMHAIQFARPVASGCAATGWVREMTAQWVQDYVTDPIYGIGLGPDDTEFQAAPKFLDSPTASLDASSPKNHDYGAYLLPQWAVRRGDDRFVRKVWDALATKRPRQAVDAALPGGFAEQWDDFVLSTWNKGPVTHFRDWDGLTAGAANTASVDVDEPAVPVEVTVPVNDLAAQLVRVWPDKRLKELEVTHDRPGDPSVKIKAIVGYSDGTHAVIDLSEKATTVICLDDGTKRVNLLELVYSNADLSADVDVETALVGSTTCGCAVATPGPRPTAAPAAPSRAPVCVLEADLTYTYTDEFESRDDRGRVEWEGGEDETGELTLVLEEDPEAPGDYVSTAESRFVGSGVATSTWHRYLHDDGCGDQYRTYRTTADPGPMEARAVTAFLDDRTGDLLLGLATHAATTSYHGEARCVETVDDTYDSIVVSPRCAPDGLTPFYRLEPVGQEGRTFRIDCTDTWTTYGPDNQVHTHRSTVTGTVTLP
jgi:hypothetical protein